MKRRSEACPPAYHWISVSVAGESSIRYSADIGASSASRDQQLDRRHVRHDEHGLLEVAREHLVARRGHPPAYVVERLTARRPHRAVARARRPAAPASPRAPRRRSAPPTRRTRTRGSRRPRAPSRPRAAATASAVCRVRRIGELTTASIATSRGQPLGHRARLAPPVRDSSRVVPAGAAEPLLRRCARVSPCRSSTVVVGVPRSGSQPTSGSARAPRPRRARRRLRRPTRRARSSAVLSAGDHASPRAAASSASFASRSACLFRSRGTQV